VRESFSWRLFRYSEPAAVQLLLSTANTLYISCAVESFLGVSRFHRSRPGSVVLPFSVSYTHGSVPPSGASTSSQQGAPTPAQPPRTTQEDVDQEDVDLEDVDMDRDSDMGLQDDDAMGVDQYVDRIHGKTEALDERQRDLMLQASSTDTGLYPPESTYSDTQ
jgi:hypothetical protein